MGKGKLGAWECCWCPALSLGQDLTQGWDRAPAPWSLLLPFSRQTWEAESLLLIILSNLGILTQRGGCAWVFSSVLGMEKEFFPNICLFLRSDCDDDTCVSSTIKVLEQHPKFLLGYEELQEGRSVQTSRGLYPCVCQRIHPAGHRTGHVGLGKPGSSHKASP